jgi:hypothetical protein
MAILTLAAEPIAREMEERNQIEPAPQLHPLSEVDVSTNEMHFALEDGKRFGCAEERYRIDFAGTIHIVDRSFS